MSTVNHSRGRVFMVGGVPVRIPFRLAPAASSNPPVAAGRSLDLNMASVDGSLAYTALQNVHIYGNTMLTGSHMLEPPDGGYFSIVRMTKYNPSINGGLVTLDTNVRFYDNIIGTYTGGTSPQALELSADIPGFSANNNIYYVPLASGGEMFKRGSTTYTLAEWRTLTGNDAHSLSGNPGFVNGLPVELNSMVPGTPASQAACIAEATSMIESFPLASNSPGKSSGASQGATLFYDYANATRSATTPTIGAFE